MNTLKKIWQFVIHPKIWFALLVNFIGVIEIAITVILLVKGIDNVINYVLYVMSAVFLAYMVYTSILLFPKTKNTIKRIASKYEFTNNMMKNYGYRTTLFTICSFLINMIYCIFQIALAILTSSIWYTTLACYYIILSIMRGTILLSKKRSKKNSATAEIRAYKTYRNTGAILMLIIVIISGMVLLSIHTGKPKANYDLAIYAIALYSFYKLTIAIINIAKAKKLQNITIQAIRNINLCEALVSILSLQFALIEMFGSSSQYWFNILTSLIISVIIIALGVYMTIKANKKIKQIKGEQNERGQQV